HRAIVADHGAFRETEPRGKNGDFTHAMLLLMDGVPSRLAVLGMLEPGMRCHRLFPCITLDGSAYGSMIHSVVCIQHYATCCSRSAGGCATARRKRRDQTLANDRFGVRWGLAGGTTLASVEEVRAAARFADASVFDSLWVSHAMAVHPIVALACV